MEAYFYWGKNLGDIIYHSCVCLAEGFTEMGLACYSDFSNCLTGIGKDFLIKYDDRHFISDADIVIIHYTIYERDPRADETLVCLNKAPRKYITIFLDDSDGLRTPGFRKGAQSCDYVLKSHYNRLYQYPDNFYPWQFGVSNRILNAVSPLPYSQRVSRVLVNFRAKHQLRDYVGGLLQPVFSKYMDWNTECDTFTSDTLEGDDLLFWKQTGARHYPDYYKKLSSSTVCACYGGVFAIPVGNYNKYTAKIARIINNAFPIFEWDRVRQWDSWRLWEAWTAACCVIHVDLEKYGCVLPIMPVNGKHYIGIDIKNVDKLEALLSENAKMPKEASLLGEIAANGREFVLENYTPRKVAERLLDMIRIR